MCRPQASTTSTGLGLLMIETIFGLFLIYAIGKYWSIFFAGYLLIGFIFILIFRFIEHKEES